MEHGDRNPWMINNTHKRYFGFINIFAVSSAWPQRKTVFYLCTKGRIGLSTIWAISGLKREKGFRSVSYLILEHMRQRQQIVISKLLTIILTDVEIVILDDIIHYLDHAVVREWWENGERRSFSLIQSATICHTQNKDRELKGLKVSMRSNYGKWA